MLLPGVRHLQTPGDGGVVGGTSLRTIDWMFLGNLEVRQKPRFSSALDHSVNRGTKAWIGTVLSHSDKEYIGVNRPAQSPILNEFPKSEDVSYQLLQHHELL